MITRSSTSRLIIIIAGTGLLLVSLAVAWNQTSGTVSGFGRGPFVGLLAGFLLVGVGLLWHRTLVVYRGTAIILLNTVFLVLVLEAGLSLFGKIRNLTPADTAEIQPSRLQDSRKAIPYYRSEEWGDRFWQEYFGTTELSKMYYFPFSVWRHRAHKGEFHNINSDGIRYTPGDHQQDRAVKIFAFGGSTMWGDGSPDFGTIPAFLHQQLVLNLTSPVSVTNFGEVAYCSTQELILLLRELQKGNIPDVVIFYDGINDIYSAYQSGRPDLHHNYGSISEKINTTDQPRSRLSLVRSLLESAIPNTLRLVRTLVRSSSNEPAPANSIANYQTMGVTSDELSTGIIKIYFGNYELVESLSRYYGFRWMFFWQPVVFSGAKKLTPVEEQFTSWGDPPLRDLFQATYQKVNRVSGRYPKFRDLRGVFDTTTDQVYIDYGHVSPQGNRMVAQRMMAEIDEHYGLIDNQNQTRKNGPPKLISHGQP